MRNGIRAAIVVSVVALGIAAWTAGGRAQSPSPAPPAAASSAPPLGSSRDVQALRERAAEFWAARMASDPQGQWALLEPRGRGRMTAQEYGADRGAVKYVAYQVEDATVTGYFATVKVRLLFQPVLPTPRQIPVQAVVADDKWIRVGGAWYRQLD